MTSSASLFRELWRRVGEINLPWAVDTTDNSVTWRPFFKQKSLLSLLPASVWVSFIAYLTAKEDHMEATLRAVCRQASAPQMLGGFEVVACYWKSGCWELLSGRFDMPFARHCRAFPPFARLTLERIETAAYDDTWVGDLPVVAAALDRYMRKRKQLLLVWELVRLALGTALFREGRYHLPATLPIPSWWKAPSHTYPTVYLCRFMQDDTWMTSLKVAYICCTSPPKRQGERYLPPGEADWIEDVYQKACVLPPREVADLLADRVHNLLRQEMFDTVKAVLDHLDTDRLPPMALTGVLTLTRRAAAELSPERDAFYQRVYTSLQESYRWPPQRVQNFQERFGGQNDRA